MASTLLFDQIIKELVGQEKLLIKYDESTT